MSMHRCRKSCYTIGDGGESVPIVRHPHSRTRVVFKSVKPDKTVQSEKDKCDIKKIVDNSIRTTGFLPPVVRQGVFADVANLNRDFTTIVGESRDLSNKLKKAERDKKVRDREKKAQDSSKKAADQGAGAAAPASEGTPNGAGAAKTEGKPGEG